MSRSKLRNRALHEEAIRWVHSHKNELIEQFASDAICPPTEKPLSLFMAGSPGAGKTEASLALVDALSKFHIPIVRIDPDEIRAALPQYTGNNTDDIKGASFIAVEKLHDYVLAKRKSMILDSTFTPYKKIADNVQRSINKDRIVHIIYIYQHPLAAWRFTKEREKIEGRSVPRAFFIQTLFEARQNVKKIKKKFGDYVEVTALKKNYERDTSQFFYNVQNIDEIIKFDYSISDLRRILR